MSDILDEDQKALREAVVSLRQRFDTVQVFVTRVEPDGNTMRGIDGSGDFFARFGLSKLWVDNCYIDDEDE